MDLKDLMNERAVIHDVAKSLTLDPSIDAQVSKRCEAISIVSENPLHWEFVVAASGFIRSRGQTTNEISEILDIIRAEPVEAKTYFDAVTTLSTDQILSAGSEVARIADLMQFHVMDILSPAEDCCNECLNMPASEIANCYRKCLGLPLSLSR